MNTEPRSNPGKLILDVVAADLCIACGACVHACPPSVIESIYNETRGAFEVHIRDQSACVSCSAPCEQVCPSVEVDFSKLGIGSKMDGGPVSREGSIRETWLGYSPDFQHNGVSSSGGFIRGVIRHSLDHSLPVVCLCADGNDYAPRLLHSTKDLTLVPGSIYHGVSFVKLIDVLHEANEPVLLIATPCQLEGLYKYIKIVEPVLAEKIAIVVGLICGWMYSNHALHAFASFKKISSPVLNAHYRGEDKVGRLKLYTETETFSYDRRRFDTKREYYDFRACFSSMLNRLRCRLCENHVNVLADIAVGDAWLKRRSDEKLSIIVVRSPTGSDLMARMQEAEEVKLIPAEPADLNESQSDNLVYGYVARQLNRFVAHKGIAVPRFYFAEPHTPMPYEGLLVRMLYHFEYGLRKLVRQGRYRLFRKGYWFYAKYKVLLAKTGKLPK